MKTIISASRRTDIPAFYLNWFKDAVRAGFVDVANPIYPRQIRRVDLSPETVGWIVFWSRNYARFLKDTAFFSAYHLFFHFTILPQSKLEPLALPLDKALAQMERLAALFGPERIIWRYDPLVFWLENGTLHTNHSPERFKALCQRMASFGIKRCYTSFAHPYSRFKSRFTHAFPNDTLFQPEQDFQHDTLSKMVDMAGRYGMEIYSCSNDRLLQTRGVLKGRCIDGKLLQTLEPDTRVSIAKAPSRPDCGCTQSIDIGSYQLQPCHFGCLYCYANPIRKKVKSI